MSYVKKYSVLPPLGKIYHHDKLPQNSHVIERLRQGSKSDSAIILFVKRGAHLSFLEAYTTKWDTGSVYSCDQYDFPLEVLPWFPKALEDFRKPPAEGGLPAGAMISRDQNVGGEMLAVGSTTRGYNITNWSRDANGVDADPDYYEPTTLNLDHELLYDFGLLALWKELGEKYESGLL